MSLLPLWLTPLFSAGKKSGMGGESKETLYAFSYKPIAMTGLSFVFI